MTARWGPEYEMKRVIVAEMRGDSDLNALLFPADVPAVSPYDHRVFDSAADLPSNLRGILPRILVEVDSESIGYEQEDPAGDMGPITVRLHHFVEADDQERIEDLSKRTTEIIKRMHFETPPAPDRIIAAELVKAGIRIKNREPAFNDAYRLTETYLSRLVGVIA
jgi:hypothetical protein